ncbi:hypothetical protein F4821DRAFT_259455 [Hypoxylon rubiginosum]|uniref:Uncharacterized protein n=1 Tax=Hypoxylon rubiginosum TaxID=110542 RepID=A0ACC0D2L2_9PEZI|nr:hypothetical protein F4821DRAFT_259455 [Hypoxylon rubiginosum]
MTSQNEYVGFRVQPDEYPNGQNDYGESDHPPKAFDRPTPIMRTAKPSSFSQQQSSGHSNPFGLSPLAFGMLIALVTALIVGATIGAGLGVSLAKKERCDASVSMATSMLASTSATATALVDFVAPKLSLNDYVVPEPSLVESLHTDCPKIDGTVIEDSNSDHYRVTCGHRVVGNPSIITWSGLIAYLLQHCVQACFLINNWGGHGEQLCTAVSWSKAMSHSAEINAGANCWLFNYSADSIELEESHTIAVMLA